MSGHSHWATIRHKKGAADAKKGQLFSKLARLITMAAKAGGGDPSTNAALALHIEKARAGNMPKDTIEKAIKKGTGELPGVSYESVTYEGYGPGGTAIIVEGVTDNRNRTVSEIRKIFESRGGRMGEANCVAFLFETRGVILIPAAGVDEDALTSDALDAGAENMERAGGDFQITTDPREIQKVVRFLKEKKYNVVFGEVSRLPKSRISVPPDVARRLVGLMEALEDHEDVQNVYTNCELPEEIAAEKG